MKIIDKKTGTRVGADPDAKAVKKKLKEEDPILRNADKEENLEEYSAMDPPDAYDKERAIGADYDTMNPFIQGLMDEHKELIDEVNAFEKSMIEFKESGFMFTRAASDSFNKFFKYFDNHIVPHNEKEEHHFFRMLHDRLIESGEHGNGADPETAVDLMEDDHNKFIQLATLSFNLLGLGSRLRDLESKGITFDLAYNNGKELAELIRLHIFREDETLFPLAQELLTEEDFEKLK
ncbi:MAG: hemerythrin domain-containing protein [Crocinitomicaceae bacterium]|nr:hemerythrin domain-containing protein [Crocinitomicaceae bacterium]